MQVMLLGFVLLGRSLEESARLKASSDMNELIVSTDLYLTNVPARSSFSIFNSIFHKPYRKTIVL
jgi:cation transport ATPase